MDLKKLVRFGLLIGSTVGGYVPTFWGAPMFSFTSLFGSLLGGLIGIWIAYQIHQRF